MLTVGSRRRRSCGACPMQRPRLVGCVFYRLHGYRTADQLHNGRYSGAPGAFDCGNRRFERNDYRQYRPVGTGCWGCAGERISIGWPAVLSLAGTLCATGYCCGIPTDVVWCDGDFGCREPCKCRL